MAKILIKNGRVWDGSKFFFADVLTEQDKIAKIEPHIDTSADFIYDATGKTVSAGLVDAHVHLRGISTEKFGTPAETSCFPFGVTAAADASGENGNKALIDSFAVKTLTFAKAKIRDNRADFTRTAERLSLFSKKAIGIKVYFDTAMSQISDISPLREICEFAHPKGLRVMVHCSGSPVKMAEILDTLGTGDILTHTFHGGANNAAEDGFEGIHRAQERGVVIDVGFAGHVHTDFGILQQAIERGIVPDVISTDITKLSAYTRGGRYGMTMCMSIAKLLGMSEEDIFRAVTSNSARALGKENDWGTLAVGRVADIAVLDYTDEGFDLTDKAGNHIQSNVGYRCRLTLSDGQVVYKD